MTPVYIQESVSTHGVPQVSGHETCRCCLLFHWEAALGDHFRAVLYFLGIAYCFIGLSAITARFFRSMENVVKHTRVVVETDPCTKAKLVRHEKVWNYAVADIALLAFGTSFPQISLATIDAIRNIGNLYAGGLGPGTLIGSAAFDLFPIHAVCVVVPKAGELKKIADVGVWLVGLFWSFWAYVWLYIILEDKRWPYLSLPTARTERPKDWVPEEATSLDHDIMGDDQCSEVLQVRDIGAGGIVDIFSIHSTVGAGTEVTGSTIDSPPNRSPYEESNLLTIWKKQFVDALRLENAASKKLGSAYLWFASILWKLLLAPWRLLFAFVPPYQIAHGWIAFICSLLFIGGIAYIVTKLTDAISCVTGINPYVIAFTALASGTSWPDLVASKIAAERQITADSAIANITCSNSVNIYVGIGVPWLIDTVYNFVSYREPLRIQNAKGLSFSLLVFFSTSVCCISVLVFRRKMLGAELGGPRVWAWLTCFYFMLLWIIFVVLSSLKVSEII